MDMITAANHPIQAQPDGDTRGWPDKPVYVPCGRYGCLLCAPAPAVRDVRVVGGKVPLATGACAHARTIRYNLTVGWCRHADDDSQCDRPMSATADPCADL